LVAKGGTPKAAADKGPNDAIALMTVLGTSLPKMVTVNKLTTVASTFTAARFIDGESISGNPLGLRIAAGNVPNLVDPATGNWGKVLLDPLNSLMTTTMANLDTSYRLQPEALFEAAPTKCASFRPLRTSALNTTPSKKRAIKLGEDSSVFTTHHPLILA
jgi:hypothetical protein